MKQKPAGKRFWQVFVEGGGLIEIGLTEPLELDLSRRALFYLLH
jgi:hypothetical protein